MNYADIRPIDVANGPGVRVSLFVSGCTHHCKECFNPETWDFNYGHPFGDKQIQQIPDLLSKPYINGLSILGGEPFEPQNQQTVLELIKQVRNSLPEKNIWCYTGYLFEDLAADRIGVYSSKLLNLLDVLVDGPFIIEKKDLSLRFCGSSNQRLIDVPTSIKLGQVCIWKN